jgi:hypothetical protein
MAEVDLEALFRARIRVLSDLRAEIRELSEINKATGKWVVLKKVDLRRVDRRMSEILGEELAMAWWEMGGGGYAGAPLENRDLSCCESRPDGVRCNRPVVAIARNGDGCGNVCRKHKYAYERACQRIVAEFGEGVWDAVPDYCQLSICDEPALPKDVLRYLRAALKLEVGQPEKTSHGR